MHCALVPLVAIERAVAEAGWKVVLMLRLSPAFPFTAVNYAAGLTCISFWDFMGASAVGLIPGRHPFALASRSDIISLAYSYAGSLAVDLKEVISGHTRLSPLTLLLLGGVSAACFGAAVALLTMYTRRHLRRHLREDEDERSVDDHEEQRPEAGTQQGQGHSDPLL
ncbi:probable TVP38/TMEM64 family membrane protein slr0305 [Coccomyxa sp. Obi]|nr:probable TVP38/TMEM64 family membrane protein slr0305 [Coccomyxa sp. Obi]